MEKLFDCFLWIMTALAVVVFIVLQRVEAGYGMLLDRKWGPTVPNRAGWVLMEAPVFVLMAVLWLLSPRRCETVPLVFLAFFQAHYFHRAFIFPLLMRGRGRMPLSIILMGVTFNACNALMQGGWIFWVSPPDAYPATWLLTPQFIAGAALFIFGMGVNLHSDRIIRRLRLPGDSGHYIPKGGMFRWVSSANYFGELVEWCGFAVMTWSWAGAVFALWTFANLAPRAEALRRRYATEFGKEFTSLNRKRIIPFIY